MKTQSGLNVLSGSSRRHDEVARLVTPKHLLISTRSRKSEGCRDTWMISYLK